MQERKTHTIHYVYITRVTHKSGRRVQNKKDTETEQQNTNGG